MRREESSKDSPQIARLASFMRAFARKEDAMGRFAATISAACAASALAAVQFPVINPSQLHWKPKDALPPGAYGAVVRGDPAQGPYAFFGRFPARFTVPMHWHTNDVAVVMTHGSMKIEPEHGPAATIEQGGYFFLPGKMRYVATCAQPCTFLAWGEQPFDILYERAEDDPRLRASR